jgi:hypothetical protein
VLKQWNFFFSVAELQFKVSGVLCKLNNYAIRRRASQRNKTLLLALFYMFTVPLHVTNAAADDLSSPFLPLIREVPISCLGPDTVYTVRDFSWFFCVRLGKFRDNTN